METEFLVMFVSFAMVTTAIVATILIVGEVWDGFRRGDCSMCFDVVVKVPW